MSERRADLDLNAIARRWIDGTTVRSDNTDIPALLDEVAWLRAERARLRAVLDPLLERPVIDGRCLFCAPAQRCGRRAVSHRTGCVTVPHRRAALSEEASP